jgi:hypothetical protein
MKKHKLITKLAVAFVVAGIPIAAQANGTSQDKTATGSIKLSKPGFLPTSGGVQGGYSSNVSFSAVVAETTGVRLDQVVLVNGKATEKGTLVKRAARFSNKSIIESVPSIGVGNAGGKSLVLLNDGNLSPDRPRLAVYDRKAKAFVALVDDNLDGGLLADFDWIDFVGVYGGSATVSETTSNTVVLSAGSYSGSTGYEATLNVANNKLPMVGVGSFKMTAIKTSKKGAISGGITGSARLSGVYKQP